MTISPEADFSSLNEATHDSGIDLRDDAPRSDTIIDLTHTLIASNVPACPGHPHFDTTPVLSIDRGDDANVSILNLGTHTGTHVDAPWHFVPSGQTVDELDISLLSAVPVLIVDLRNKKRNELIEWADMERHETEMRKGVAVLLCTGWSRYWGDPEYNYHPFLSADAARRLLDQGVKVIGMDALGPDEIMRVGEDTAFVHRVFLGAGGIIVENLMGLERLLEGQWKGKRLVASFLPLKLGKCDGSPIRAVAWEAGTRGMS